MSPIGTQVARSAAQVARAYLSTSRIISSTIKIAEPALASSKQNTKSRVISEEDLAAQINAASIKLSSDPSATSLGASIPAIALPPFVGDILKEICNNPESLIRFYSSRSCRGVPDLQIAAKKYYERKGIKNIESQAAIFTNSEHNLITMLIDLLHDERGSAIMTLPTFGLFFNALYNRGIKTNFIPLAKDTDWKITPNILYESLNAKENKNARVFFFINPDNPTGKSYSKAELEELAKVFLAHNEERNKKEQAPLILLSDEASRRILLDPQQQDFCSIASFSGMEQFTLTISTSSKDLAPGIAICHGIGPKSLIDSMLHEKRGLLPDVLVADRYGPSYFAQHLLAEIFSGKYDKEFEQHLKDSLQIYRNNLDIIKLKLAQTNSALSEKFGPRPNEEKYIEIVTMPDGGLQCLIQAIGFKNAEFPSDYQHAPKPEQKTMNNSLDLACYLQKIAKVQILPGEFCGIDGEEMMFRVTISKETEKLKNIFDNIQKALIQLNPEKIKEKPPTTFGPSDSKKAQESSLGLDID